MGRRRRLALDYPPAPHLPWLRPLRCGIMAHRTESLPPRVPAMPSFDIVSRTDLAEVDNAVQGAAREIATRFDFKGSNCSFERTEATVTLKADDDYKLKQMQELLRGHMARRKVEVGA